MSAAVTSAPSAPKEIAFPAYRRARAARRSSEAL